MVTDMEITAWFVGLPLPVQVVLGVVALAVAAGVVLGVLQAAGLLPASWSAEAFRQWFDRRRDRN